MQKCMRRSIAENCRFIPPRKCRWTIHRSIWLQKAQIHQCSFCKNRFYHPNLQFAKKKKIIIIIIKKMRFLLIHDFIIITRHCQSFLVHKDDDRISCIYVEKLWRPISDIINVERPISDIINVESNLISCALCVLISRICYTFLKLHPPVCF